MFRKLAKGLVTLVLLATCVACGSHGNPNKTPPGVAAHLPGSTANAIANQADGTCRLLAANQIQTATGGTSSAPQADNLTPGLDRCSWTVHGSDFAKGDVVIVATRSNLPPPSAPTAKTPEASKTTPIAVPDLGSGAAWTASQYALAWPEAKGSIALQIVASNGQTIDPAKALPDLVTLAELIKSAASVAH